MSIFISYSHSNAAFVDRLSVELVKKNAHVWLDKWELSVGDSLIEKIQQAIEECSALLVILSQASTESEWCKKELSVGLIRELEQKQVVILPVLYEDCKIPLFLRDKVYADFRISFDDGLQSVLSTIAKVTNDTAGRIQTKEYFVDWAYDWGYSKDKHFIMNFVLVEQCQAQHHTILSQITVQCNKTATNRYKQYERENLAWIGRHVIIECITSALESKEVKLLLTDQFPKTTFAEVVDQKNKINFKVHISCRRLGEDTGKDILFNVFGHLIVIRENIKLKSRKVTHQEALKLARILSIPIH